MRVLTSIYLTVFVIFVGLTSARAAVTKAEISDITVFVFTAGPDEGELVNPQTVSRHKQALRAVDELKKRLAKRMKVSEQRDQADVMIEVLARGAVAPGTPMPSVDTSKDGTDGIHVSLAAGDYRMDLAGDGPRGQIIGARQAAAKNVADKIEVWIGSNRDNLIAKRARVNRLPTVTNTK
jgi:ribosomal protein L31E